MEVYKFGGASVKDAAGVKNVLSVLQLRGGGSLLLVVSAMGKTTNALELVLQEYMQGMPWELSLAGVKQFHLNILQELFPAEHRVYTAVNHYFEEIRTTLIAAQAEDYSFLYDQIVSKGELISSKILSEYLRMQGFENQWLDACQYIRTDETHREGAVQWQETEQRIKSLDAGTYVTQGFIGGTETGTTTTLGREGSDYTAAIFAYCLDAQSVTIWKDVPGVMSADPRKFPDATLLSDISYEEAIEMAYYGASVIHPKTLQPLKQKHIPFYVKSFVEPALPGTTVRAAADQTYLPSIIIKENLLLLRLSTKDFSFIAEEHLSLIFGELTRQKIKVALMQNSAISLSLVLEDKYGNFESLERVLQPIFRISSENAVALLTIRHCGGQPYERYAGGREILLEQMTNKTVQMVIK